MEKVLKQLGLSENQAKVYLSFLNEGERMAAEIARKLKMDKSSCYRAVEELVQKNLLVPNPKKRGTTYTAANPEVLNELLINKQSEINNLSTSIKRLIEVLNSQQTSERTTYIKVEKGIEVIRSSMERNLEEAYKSDKIIREKYRLDYPYFKDPTHVKFVNEFAQRRIKMGVSIRQIVNFAGLDIFSPIKKTSPKLLKEIRLMPDDLKDYNSMRVSGYLTSITSFDEKKDYIVINIYDKYVSELYKNLFDFVWNKSKVYNTD